jgi:thioredoxin
MADKKVKVILQDSDFQKELVYANDKLVLVDFFATWCKPCDEIAPAVEELNKNYHRSVVFLKVDIDACSNTARRYEVKSLPTFTFFHKTEKLDQVLGADKESLEAGIVKHLNNMKHPLPSADDDSDTTSAVSPTVDSFTNVSVKGQMNLNIIIDKGSSECLNECDPHPFINALINDPSYLQSDCDEQVLTILIISWLLFIIVS